MSNKSPQDRTLEELLQEISVILHGGGVATIREAMAMSWLCDGTLDNDDAIDELLLYVKRSLYSHMQTAFDDVIGEDEEKPGNMVYYANLVKSKQRQRAAEWLLGSKENGPTV